MSTREACDGILIPTTLPPGRKRKKKTKKIGKHIATLTAYLTPPHSSPLDPGTVALIAQTLTTALVAYSTTSHPSPSLPSPPPSGPDTTPTARPAQRNNPLSCLLPSIPPLVSSLSLLPQEDRVFALNQLALALLSALDATPPSSPLSDELLASFSEAILTALPVSTTTTSIPPPPPPPLPSSSGAPPHIISTNAASLGLHPTYTFISPLLLYILRARSAQSSKASSLHLSSIVHMLEARQPRVHLHLLHIIATLPPDSEYLNMAANLVFHFYPPGDLASDDLAFRSDRGVSLPPPFARTQSSAILRGAVSSLLSATAFDANEAGMVLLTRWCLPDDDAALAPTGIRTLLDGLLSWFDNSSPLALIPLNDDLLHARRQLESSYVLPWIDRVASFSPPVGIQVILDAVAPDQVSEAPHIALYRLASLVTLASPALLLALLRTTLPAWLDALTEAPFPPSEYTIASLKRVFSSFERMVHHVQNEEPHGEPSADSTTSLLVTTLAESPHTALGWLRLLTQSGVQVDISVFLSGLEGLEETRHVVACAELCLDQLRIGAAFSYQQLARILPRVLDRPLSPETIRRRSSVAFVNAVTSLVSYAVGAKVVVDSVYLTRAPLVTVELPAASRYLHWLFALFELHGPVTVAGAAIRAFHALLVQPNYVANKDSLLVALLPPLLPIVWKTLDVRYDFVSSQTYALLRSFLTVRPAAFDDILATAFGAPQWFVRYDAVEKGFGLFVKLKPGSEAMASFGAAFSRLVQAELDENVSVRTKAYLELSSLDHDQIERGLACLTAYYNEADLDVQSFLLTQLVRFRRDFGSYQVVPWVSVLQGLTRPEINLTPNALVAVQIHKGLMIEAALEMLSAHVPIDSGSALKLLTSVAAPLTLSWSLGSCHPPWMLVLIDRLTHLLDINLEVGSQFLSMIYTLVREVFSLPPKSRSGVESAAALKLLLVALFKYDVPPGDAVPALNAVFESSPEHESPLVLELTALVALSVLRTMPAVSVQLLYVQFEYAASMIQLGTVASSPRPVAFAYFYLEQALLTFAEAGYYVILFSELSSSPRSSLHASFLTLSAVLREGAARGLALSIDQPVVDVSLRLHSVPLDASVYAGILDVASTYVASVWGAHHSVALPVLDALVKLVRTWPESLGGLPTSSLLRFVAAVVSHDCLVSKTSSKRLAELAKCVEHVLDHACQGHDSVEPILAVCHALDIPKVCDAALVRAMLAQSLSPQDAYVLASDTDRMLASPRIPRVVLGVFAYTSWADTVRDLGLDVLAPTLGSVVTSLSKEEFLSLAPAELVWAAAACGTEPMVSYTGPVSLISILTVFPFEEAAESALIPMLMAIVMGLGTASDVAYLQLLMGGAGPKLRYFGLEIEDWAQELSIPPVMWSGGSGEGGQHPTLAKLESKLQTRIESNASPRPPGSRQAVFRRLVKRLVRLDSIPLPPHVFPARLLSSPLQTEGRRAISILPLDDGSSTEGAGVGEGE